jgi:succinate dehydrogenase / fumarate reductase cytochrome b subunit
VRIVSLGLIAGVLYHSFNGIRIMLIDFVPQAVRYQRSIFWGVMALTVVSFLPMAYFVIAPIFGLHTGNTAAGM